MLREHAGFTLIELMIVIAIIGILATIAVPSFVNYTNRAKVAEALAALAPAKTDVAEYFAANGAMPPDSKTAGITSSFNGKYTASIDYAKTSSTASTITATLSDNASLPEDLRSTTIDFTATGGASGMVSWECHSGSNKGVPSQYLPASCR